MTTQRYLYEEKPLHLAALDEPQDDLLPEPATALSTDDRGVGAGIQRDEDPGLSGFDGAKSSGNRKAEDR